MARNDVPGVVVKNRYTLTPLTPPYPRESGVLVRTTADGDELRIHQNGCGEWEAREWYTGPFGVVCRLRTMLSALDWVEAGEAMRATVRSAPVASDQPAEVVESVASFEDEVGEPSDR